LLTAITDRAPCSVDPGRNRGVRNNASAPSRRKEVLFTDDTITIADQEIQQVKHERLDRNQRRPSTQLAPLGIESHVAKKECQERVSAPAESRLNSRSVRKKK